MNGPEDKSQVFYLRQLRTRNWSQSQIQLVQLELVMREPCGAGLDCGLHESCGGRGMLTVRAGKAVLRTDQSVKTGRVLGGAIYRQRPRISDPALCSLNGSASTISVGL